MAEVLLIGWDGAGWSQIDPLLDSGAMPNLSRLVEQGVIGHLASMSPLCPSLLWTSVATGQFADRHGILDTVEPDPRTGGVRPATKASLHAPQIWDLLAQEGFECRVAGWPVTHPAGPPATCVSDGFAHEASGSIYPPGLESRILPLRFQPQEWTGSEMELFVPELKRIDQDRDKRLARLAVLLAEDVSVHAAATTLMEDKADFTAVWYGAAGQACALFPADTDEVYMDVVGGVYRFLDLMLGRLLRLAGPKATVMLVSDRAASEPEWNASTGCGPRGMLCAVGPGIEADELLFGAGLLDIAPTVLRLFGFAPAPGMAGRAITEICATPAARTPGCADCAPAQSPEDGEVEREIAELADLGYTDRVSAAVRDEADAARQRRDFHLGRVLLAQGGAGQAIPLLERVAREKPGALDVRLYLAHAYLRASRYMECREICEEVLAEFPDSPFAPLARAHLAIAEGDYEAAAAALARGQPAHGVTAALDAAIGEAYLRIENWDKAAAAFRSAISRDEGMAAAHCGLAQALLACGRYDEAAEAGLDAVRLRYDLAEAHEVLGRALQKLGRHESAVRALATSERLRGHAPAS